MIKQEFKIIWYANDTVVISKDADNQQKLLHIFKTAAGKFSRIIPTEKTQLLIVSREPRRCKLVIYDKIVGHVI